MIVKVPVVAPAATVTDAGTVATAALLLDSETMEPPAGAAAPTVTVPWTVAPATTLVVPSDTPDTATVVTGCRSGWSGWCWIRRTAPSQASPLRPLPATRERRA